MINIALNAGLSLGVVRLPHPAVLGKGGPEAIHIGIGVVAVGEEIKSFRFVLRPRWFL